VFQMLSNYVTSYLQVLIAEVMNWGHSTVWDWKKFPVLEELLK
jgi:hypothetical protein